MTTDLATFQNRLSKLFEEAFTGRLANRAEDQDMFASNWVPPVDVYEDDTSVALKADIPGIDPSKLEIRVDGNVLHIRGERNFEKETKKENFYRVERAYGTFTRAFTLPTNVQSDRIEASYKNGVLNIKLPKREDAKAKQVHVRVEGQDNQSR